MQTRVILLTAILLGMGAVLLSVGGRNPTTSLAQGPMPSMSPMMSMTPMPSGTHGPMPSMTPMMTTTPASTPPAGEGDDVPPQGTLLINGGAEVTASAAVTLTLSATDDPEGTGVAWMFIREWGWDHDHGWHDMHSGQHGHHHGGRGHMMAGWQEFTSPVVWEVSSEPGMKYVTVWFADAAWNVSPPATAMINLVYNDATIDAGQVHQYRRRLHAGEMMDVRVEPHMGDPDLYAWMPGHAGPPDWWSDAPAGTEQISFSAPADGVYLIEVHGYTEAAYGLGMSIQSGVASTALAEDKPLPAAPLVASVPDTSDAPRPGFRQYLPLVLNAP